MTDRKINYEEISVEYIDHMGSDKRVCNTARTSFARWEDESIELNDKDIGLLAYLATGLPAKERDDWQKRLKTATHFAPFCHNFLTVRVAVPIFLARQLHKHTVGLIISEESRRYISSEISLYLPKEVHKSPENAKQGASNELHTGTLNKDNEFTALELIEMSSQNSVYDYYELLDSGVAPEEARMVLPLNTVVHWVWSGSMLSFIRVFKQRIDPHAQLAAQEFASKLGPILQQHFPHSFNALVNL